MIEAQGLTKAYGDKVAVHDLTFTVRPGIVTGFLGPNGAGKSTTMRLILGLDAPTSGTVTAPPAPEEPAEFARTSAQTGEAAPDEPSEPTEPAPEPKKDVDLSEGGSLFDL